MAKIILKTSLANSNVNVPWTQVDAVYNKIPETTEVIITPRTGYTVNAKDFGVGLLPSVISNIQFINTSNNIDSSNKVIARVSFNKYLSKNEITSIFLPLSVSSRLSVNKIILVDITPIQNNIFVSDNTIANKETTLGPSLTNNTYTIEGKPGAKLDVFTKTFTVPSGYNFIKAPSYKISGNSSRYNVVEQVQTDQGKITSKSFAVSCTLPSITDRSLSRDIISFSASIETTNIVKPINRDGNVKIDREDYKIYSIDTGREIGVEGGTKKISIKGIPGTPFKIAISTADGNMYNVKTGLFSSGGVIEGIIPSARLGLGYGEFKQWIKVPASASATSVTINLVEDKDIDHAKIISTATADEQLTTRQEDANIFPTLTLALKDGGAVDTSASPDGHPSIFKIFRPLLYRESSTAITEFFDTNYIANGTHAVGPMPAKNPISTFIRNSGFPKLERDKSKSFSFLVTSNDDNMFLRINRQPKFATSGYARWDFATQLGYSSEDTKNHQVDGTEIKSDWGTSIIHTVTSDTSAGTDLDFETGKWGIESFEVELVGVEKGNLHGVSGAIEAGGYRYIMVNITNIVGTCGTTDLTMELNLKNFLSTY